MGVRPHDIGRCNSIGRSSAIVTAGAGIPSIANCGAMPVGDPESLIGQSLITVTGSPARSGNGDTPVTVGSWVFVALVAT